MFSGKCGKSVESYVKGKKEKTITDEICIKKFAIEHLKLIENCSQKSKYYVEDIFNQCIKDKTPFSKFGSGRKSGTGWLA